MTLSAKYERRCGPILRRSQLRWTGPTNTPATYTRKKTRQGFRTKGLPDPPGPFFIRPNCKQSDTGRDGLDFTLGTLRRAALASLAREFWQYRLNRLSQSARHAETVVVVAVVRLVVVAVGRPRILRVVVERPATQHPACRPAPSGIGL